MSKKKAEVVEAAEPVNPVAEAEGICARALVDLVGTTGRAIVRAELETRTVLDNDSGRTTTERHFVIELSE
jgi:hypothetical protein